MLTRFLFLIVVFLTATQFSAAKELELVWEYPTPGVLPQSFAVHDKDKQVVYASLKEGGVIALRSPKGIGKPTLLGTIGKHQLGNMDAMDLFVLGPTLYVGLGNFFKHGSYAGLAIISIRDPRKMQLISIWKSASPAHGCAAVVANDTRVFLGGMSKGVYVLDSTNQKKPKLLHAFLPDVDFPKPNPTRIQHPNSRGMALRGKLLYVANDAGGLRILNIAEDKPTEVSRYINQEMIGKQQAYNNIVLDRDRAFIGVDYAGLEIVDISNPRRVRQIGWWNPWQANTLKNIWFNSAGHVNQVEFDERSQLVYLSAGDSELQVVDVKRSHAPSLRASYGKTKDGQGAWGVSRSGELVFLSYITTVVPFRGTWCGIRALR